MLTFSVRKPPTVYLDTCRYLFGLYGDCLVLKLRYCSCILIEFDVERAVFVPLNTNVDRVHIELDDKLGVDVEIVESIVIPVQLIDTWVIRPVHERLHRSNTIHHKHDGLFIFFGKVQDVVNVRCVFWLPYHNHVVLKKYSGVE